MGTRAAEHRSQAKEFAVDSGGIGEKWKNFK